MNQMRFEAMKELKPPEPGIRDEAIAKRIAERIVNAVNLDEFYWTPDEIEERVADVTSEIVLNGDPKSVFQRLVRNQRPVNCAGKKEGHPYAFVGIDDHCRNIAAEITGDELIEAQIRYQQRYGT